MLFSKRMSKPEMGVIILSKIAKPLSYSESELNKTISSN